MSAIPLWPDGVPGPAPVSDHAEARLVPALTPYLPVAGTGLRAACIVCPGGGYGMRAEHEGAPVAQWLAGLGIAAFVLDYRVAPWRHPAPLADAQRAIRLVRARAPEFAVDPTRIGILGFSAGGHLAVSAATFHAAADPDAADPLARVSSRPDACIACYPVISLGEHRHHGSLVHLLGEPWDEADRQRLSLEHAITADNPPTFCWHTSDDDAVPVENALLLAGALRRHRVPVALHIFPHGAHGLGLASAAPLVGQWPTLAAHWLADLGFC